MSGDGGGASAREGGRDLDGAPHRALSHVRARAHVDARRDREWIGAVLASAGVDAPVDRVLEALAQHGTLTVNFHPDRLLARGATVADALSRDGRYRSQFETRVSSGGLTAFPGGDRDRWEGELFGGAYQEPGVGSDERPIYGGWNLANHTNGACPGFGSCHLRLRHGVSERATYLYGDSARRLGEVGHARALAPVLAPLLDTLARGDGALGLGRCGVARFVEGLLRGEHCRAVGLFAPRLTTELDDYVEAQVHGQVRLAVDVEAVVVDAAFVGTESEAALRRVAERHGVGVEIVPGPFLDLEGVPTVAPEGPTERLRRWQILCADGRARRLAQRVVAGDPRATGLEAAVVGRAAREVVLEPGRWTDWGPPDQVLVHLKDLWRMVVVLGRPAQ